MRRTTAQAAKKTPNSAPIAGSSTRLSADDIGELAAALGQLPRFGVARAGQPWWPQEEGQFVVQPAAPDDHAAPKAAVLNPPREDDEWPGSAALRPKARCKANIATSSYVVVCSRASAGWDLGRQMSMRALSGAARPTASEPRSKPPNRLIDGLLAPGKQRTDSGWAFSRRTALKGARVNSQPRTYDGGLPELQRRLQPAKASNCLRQAQQVDATR